MEARDGQSRCTAVSLLPLGTSWGWVDDATQSCFTTRMEKLLNVQEAGWVYGTEWTDAKI